MAHNIFSSNLAAQCLAIIREHGLAVAIDIADELKITGTRETKRRHIRALVQHLREDGNMIIADTMNGYFLTDDAADWQNYLNGRQIDAKRILGKTGKQLKMAADNKGQGLLFVPPLAKAV